MKVKSINLRNFKQFHELRIQNIPETAKLVVLTGPNGCGKSSVFDGLLTQAWFGFQPDGNWNTRYHPKAGNKELDPHEAVKVEFHNFRSLDEGKAKGVHFRASHRNEPRFTISGIDQPMSQADEEKIKTMAENDSLVKRNYIRLATIGVNNAFESLSGDFTLNHFRENLIGKIREALRRVFPDLHLMNLSNPLKTGTFFFKKGDDLEIEYANLSSGEKSAFDIILDLAVKMREYDHALFCIDEPELHLHSSLQGLLLGEMINLIGNKSQLWIATNSIGMMRKAKALASENPESIKFIDFGGLDFHQKIILEPNRVNQKFWKTILATALDDLAELVIPKTIVICEGGVIENLRNLKMAHDADCLNKIFSDEFPETQFLTGGGCNEIIGDKYKIMMTLKLLSTGLKVFRLIDRDSRSLNEEEHLKQEGIRVLSRRNLESYLFDDEVLKKLCVVNQKEKEIQKVLGEKKRALENSVRRGNPDDDLKKAAGEIFNSLKKILGLKRGGSDCRVFMRDTLAPLIVNGTKTYNDLKADIFHSCV